jgi:hypothetical protein
MSASLWCHAGIVRKTEIDATSSEITEAFSEKMGIISLKGKPVLA